MSRTCGLASMEDEEDEKEGGEKMAVSHVEAHRVQYRRRSLWVWYVLWQILASSHACFLLEDETALQMVVKTLSCQCKCYCKANYK